ncbi:hypothetical protein F5X97DRAFT_326069 [Nemania serpens]|nr:hypothetical protein F5X97DRAFT_326069 [Nemania serpens]
MAEHVSIPLQITPLLAGSEERGYSTMRPKLRLIIPSSRGVSDQITSEDNLVATMDEMSYDGDISGSYSTCPGTAHCEYCIEQGLNHTLQAYHQRRDQGRCTKAQRVKTAVAVYIWFYMHLIGVIMLLMLIFLLSVYMNARLDREYPEHPRWSIPGLNPY